MLNKYIKIAIKSKFLCLFFDALQIDLILLFFNFYHAYHFYKRSILQADLVTLACNYLSDVSVLCVTGSVCGVGVGCAGAVRRGARAAVYRVRTKSTCHYTCTHPQADQQVTIPL